jgi:nucleoid-associated protein YgaU
MSSPFPPSPSLCAVTPSLAVVSSRPRLMQNRAPQVRVARRQSELQSDRSRMARVYRRRRAVVGLISGLIVIGGVLLSTAIAGPGGVPASAFGAGEVLEPMTIVVRSGDTLWSIAHEYRGEIPHARYLDYIIRLNGGPSLVVGQQLRLP